MRMKTSSRLLLCATLLLGSAAVRAQDGAVYQCSRPNAPVLYTDAVGVKQAREQGQACQPVQAVPVTIPQGPRLRAATAPAAAGASAPPRAAVPSGERVPPPQQRERDNEARAILQAELQREQARLQLLLAEYNDGQPERQGNERNYQRYLDRVAALKASIERSSADIAALQRELARLPRP